MSLFRDALVPVGWAAVVLADTAPLLQHERMLFSPADACVLLRVLESVHAGAAQGPGGAEDALGVLGRIGGGGEKAAAQRLLTVRLALARYYARCASIDVGGRSSGLNY